MIPLIEIAGNKNTNAANEVRECLNPLQRFAVETNCAILGIAHLAKYRQTEDALERVLGSSAWTAKPRMVLIAHKNDAGQRMLLRAKSNLGPDGGGFEYALVQNSADINYARFGNTLEGDATALSAPVSTVAKELEQDFAEYLGSIKPSDDWPKWKGLTVLCTANGAMDALELSKTEAQRLRRKINVVSKRDGASSQWFWCRKEG